MTEVSRGLNGPTGQVGRTEEPTSRRRERAQESCHLCPHGSRGSMKLEIPPQLSDYGVVLVCEEDARRYPQAYRSPHPAPTDALIQQRGAPVERATTRQQRRDDQQQHGSFLVVEPFQHGHDHARAHETDRHNERAPLATLQAPRHEE